MNRKTYSMILALLICLALGFLTGCGGSSNLPAATNNYVFYGSGQEPANAANGGFLSYYAFSGVVTINVKGEVVAATGNATPGELDYNDGDGITSAQPAGDAITGGTLTIGATTGQGTLTLVTSNALLGVNGTITLAIQFVNPNHALISQFDATATSSGSLDLQSSTAMPSGNFAFTASGVDAVYAPIAIAGVFTLGGASPNGLVDSNDDGTVTTSGGTANLTVSLNKPDAFGRGTFISSLQYGTTPISINYYVVGPEVIRIIDVDPSLSGGGTDSAVGSAFGQGTSFGSFTNASLRSSVFAIAGDPFSSNYGAAGQFSTDDAGKITTGVGEANELGNGLLSALASPIAGTYAIGLSGYGDLTLSPTSLGSIASLGIYVTDPTLNLNDPNNATGGGGALILDLDDVLAGGTGVVIPQTDAAVADFTGNYAVGWQNFNSFNDSCKLCESDMIAEGSMTSGGALMLSGSVSDPFLTFSTTATSTGNSFTATPLGDTVNLGRYSMLSTNVTPDPLQAKIASTNESFNLVIYQASAGQLFWLEYDPLDDNGVNSVFVGPLEQQSASLTGLP